MILYFAIGAIFILILPILDKFVEWITTAIQFRIDLITANQHQIKCQVEDMYNKHEKSETRAIGFEIPNDTEDDYE